MLQCKHKGSFFAPFSRFLSLPLQGILSNKISIPSLTHTNTSHYQPIPFTFQTLNMPDHKMTQSAASHIQSTQVSPPPFSMHSSPLTRSSNLTASSSTHPTNIHHLTGHRRQRGWRWQFFCSCSVRWRQERQSSCWSCNWKHRRRFWWTGGQVWGEVAMALLL